MQEQGEVQRSQLTVYVVDDDPAIRDSLSLSLSLRGYHIAQFASAEDFLNAYDAAWAGCVVADIRMPGMSGLQMQAALTERGSKLPVVIITGHGDVPLARTAFRGQAIDFLEKPLDDEHLIGAIETAFEHELGRMNNQIGNARREAMLSSLSPREREVMKFLVRGLHAKEIGEQLGISHRTVEVHKAHIMEKMGVRSIIDIVRLSASAAEQ
ncbi:MAG TPA: response regulator [Burkholderiales bacterium]|nr:response regulator [Burkholderiales bacterium]